MTPTQKGASPGGRKRYCGLGNHHLRPPHKTISDPKVLKFAQYINLEVRSSTLLCGLCYDFLVKMYNIKIRRAVKKKKIKAQSVNTISDVSSSQQQTTQSSTTAYSVASATPSTATTTSRPSASKAEFSAIKRTRAEFDAQTADDDDDDDEPLLSLNAVNGTRLPNIQPIPKRRQFVHENKNIMDIYIAGTSGG